MKVLYTKTEAASLCKMSLVQIDECIASGELRGFELPGSTDFRIPRQMLFRFKDQRNNGESK